MQSRHEFFEKLIHKYERYVAPLTFVFGFVFDAFTLKRIDLWVDHLVILSYLVLTGVCIVLLTMYEAGRLRARIVESVIMFVPVVMQFGFGGLFSAFVIFYTKSASFEKSWLFLIALIILFVGNERFRRRYERLAFRFGIYFVALFSYSIFLVPVLVKDMGAWIFAASGGLSVVFIALFVLLLFMAAPTSVRQARKILMVSVFGIYLLFNALYFTNIIPPVPLSLKEGGVYHFVARTETGIYAVSYEKAPWYRFLEATNSVYHWRRGEAIYFFSSIFSPAGLNVAISHRWSYYDKAQRRWRDFESIRFPISGGRDGGYRGYSFKTGIVPGRWRVDVMTDRGQVLGRHVFTVVETDVSPELTTELR